MTIPSDSSMNPQKQDIRVVHTPDPDDAFAWWAIATGRLEISGYTLHCETGHIQDNNLGCCEGRFDIAAVSSAVWPYIAESYVILASGASVGRGYGPALAAKTQYSAEELRGKQVAIPGCLTTAALVLQLFYQDLDLIEMPYNTIASAILTGEVAAGVLIHEELLNYAPRGLLRLACLGERWSKETHLPLPVGLNVVKKSLGETFIHTAVDTVRESMEEALRHRAEATTWANRFSCAKAPGIMTDFIAKFANQDTLNMDADCLAALRLLFQMALAKKLIPNLPTVEPAGGFCCQKTTPPRA